MKTLDRYIRTRLATGFVLILLLLLAVFFFLDFVEQLEDTAAGHYEALDAFVFVLLTLPERALSLVPVCALLGSLLALGILEHGNELIAMRAAGMSSRRIGWSVLKSTVLLVVIVVVLAQFIVPTLAQRAWRDRALAISGGVVVRKESGNGFWFRDGQRFIRVRDLVYGRIPTDIEIYEFKENGELTTFIHAREAEREADGAWLLKDVEQKGLSGPKIATRRHATLHWKSFLSPQQAAVMELNVESLSPTDLFYYTRDLRSRGQSTARYELALWRKINIPIATGAMVLISIPFVFGGFGRIGSTGKRVLIGSGIGIAFYLIDQMIAQIGLLADLNPAITATAPAAALLCVGILMLRRVS